MGATTSGSGCLRMDRWQKYRVSWSTMTTILSPVRLSECRCLTTCEGNKFRACAMAEKIFIPVYVPRGVRRSLQMIKRRFSGPDSTTVRIDIGGERNIEWSFLSGEMGEGPGEALDFGCEQGYLSLAAAQRGYQVIANDLEPQA